MNRNRSRGVALITAMLVVSLATILAVNMVSRQQFDVRRTANLLYAEQGRLYHYAIEDHATPLLRSYWEQLQFLTRERYEQFAAISSVGYQEEVEGGMVSAELFMDIQSRFNLNNLITAEGLVNPAAVEQFKRLLAVLDIKADFTDAVIDWIDADLEVIFPNGAEDGFYQGESPSYRTANRPMVDVSELRLIAGVTPEIFAALRPFIVALPVGSKININWASAEILQSISDKISPADAKALIESRTQKEFRTLEELTQQEVLQGKTVDLSGLVVSSDYFLLQTVVKIAHVQNSWQSLLRRTPQGRAEVILRTREFN